MTLARFPANRRTEDFRSWVLGLRLFGLGRNSFSDPHRTVTDVRDGVRYLVLDGKDSA
jgi:hypothetical protein